MSLLRLPSWFLVPLLTFMAYGLAAATLVIPDQTIQADSSNTSVNFTIGNSTWVPTVQWDNPVLFRTAGTRSSDDLRLTGSGTSRGLRLRPAPGIYGTTRITLSVNDPSGAPQQVTTFHVTVVPRAVADQVFVLNRGSSTLEVLRNDTRPAAGATRWIEQFSQPSHGVLSAGASPGTLRYTPTSPTATRDEFSYTVRYSSGESASAVCHVRIGPSLPIDAVHTDLGFVFQSGRWEAEVRADLPFGTPNLGGALNPTSVDFDEALLVVNALCRITLPSQLNAADYAFLGVAPGSSIWNLPQSQASGRLWPGFSTEGTATDAFAAFTPVGDARATSLAQWLKIELVACRMPAGAACAMSESSTNKPVVWFDTIDGINSPQEAAIGGNVSDALWITNGTHAHPDWWFTHPGRYEIDLRVRALVREGTTTREVLSPICTLHFLVADTATPDPSGLLAEQPPLPLDDVLEATEGVATRLDPLVNDSSSPDRLEELFIGSASPPSHGQIALDPSRQQLIYTPNPGFFGRDQLRYTAIDEHGGSAEATLEIHVRPQPITFLSDRTVRIAVRSSPNMLHQFQRSTNLADWSNLGQPVAADAAGNVLMIDPSPDPIRAFYRSFTLPQP